MQEHKEPEYIDFEDVVCNRETDKAIRVKIDGEEYWIPKSQISEDSEVFKDESEGTLIITEWIAEKKELM